MKIRQLENLAAKLMTDSRPDPDALLARVQAEEEKAKRGKLKIFFGAAAGVGKTYAMLRAAQELKAEGVEVVVGYVEPHDRPETTALLTGLEQLPTLQVPYRDTLVREFDLERALARKSRILLVDELAHTNAPGMTHPKRWQDVRDLLEAGIDVYSTLNVQHVESLNDVVAQITGVAVRETIPDDVFFGADEVELIDITPDELLERLREGKVYIPAQARLAMESFFRKQNLVALRELALRRTADRVHADVQAARAGMADQQTWPTNERLLVCVGPSPTSPKVIRAAKRLADALHAPWIAAHVQTSAGVELSREDQTRLAHHFKLAEQLGAETITITGENPADEVVRYAQAHNVTKIIIGKSDEPRRSRLARPNIVSLLVEQSGEIDVFVVRGMPEIASAAARPVTTVPTRRRWNLPQLFGVMTAATAVAAAFQAVGLSEGNVVMVYLAAVFFVALRWERVTSVIASVLAVVLFDVLFVPPYYTIVVDDSEYLFTFGVMLAVALMTSTLTSRIRRQAEFAMLNQRRTEAMYRLSRSLGATAVQPVLVRDAEGAAAEIFGGDAAIFVPDEHGVIRAVIDHPASFARDATETAVAQWVAEKGQPAGCGTDTLPSAQALYQPLRVGERTFGVLGLRHPQPETLLLPDRRQLLATFAQQLAQALDRCRLIDVSLEAEMEIERERLRSSLLSSVSHDLRTPLAVITGAAESLLDPKRSPDESLRLELLGTIRDEGQRLNRLVENLLHMTRLESGQAVVEKELHVLEDIVGSALHRVRPQLGRRPVAVTLSENLPLVPMDPILIEQVLINLLENSAKYSEPDSPIAIAARREADNVRMEVADRGRGLGPGEEARVFEKFFRGVLTKPGERGAGLGLAICRAIVSAHGGKIWAANRPGGGAAFCFTLPCPNAEPPEAVKPTRMGGAHVG